MGCVYAATSMFYMRDGLVKIGSSSKSAPDERMDQLSKQQPKQFFPLIWINVPSEKSAEKLLHRFFHKYKYNGNCGVEWFKNVPDKELDYGFKLIADLTFSSPIKPGFQYVNGKWKPEELPTLCQSLCGDPQ